MPEEEKQGDFHKMGVFYLVGGLEFGAEGMSRIWMPAGECGGNGGVSNW